MSATNLNPHGGNSDWALWVKIVKNAYKDKGINLTQPQSLIIAKQSYPGKGNVIGHETEHSVPVMDKSDVPPNPVRRKKQPKSELPPVQRPVERPVQRPQERPIQRRPVQRRPVQRPQERRPYFEYDYDRPEEEYSQYEEEYDQAPRYEDYRQRDLQDPRYQDDYQDEYDYE